MFWTRADLVGMIRWTIRQQAEVEKTLRKGGTLGRWEENISRQVGVGWQFHEYCATPHRCRNTVVFSGYARFRSRISSAASSVSGDVAGLKHCLTWANSSVGSHNVISASSASATSALISLGNLAITLRVISSSLLVFFVKSAHFSSQMANNIFPCLRWCGCKVRADQSQCCPIFAAVKVVGTHRIWSDLPALCWTSKTLSLCLKRRTRIRRMGIVNSRTVSPEEVQSLADDGGWC